MKRHNHLASILPGLAILAFFLSVAPSARAGDAIVVIVNSANPADNLSMAELKKLFLSDRSRWDTGKAVVPGHGRRGRAGTNGVSQDHVRNERR